MAQVQRTQSNPGNAPGIGDRDARILYSCAITFALPVIIGTAALVATSASKVQMSREIKPHEKPPLIQTQNRSQFIEPAQFIVPMDYVVHPTIAGLTEKALKDFKITDPSKKEELRQACYEICLGISSLEQIKDRLYLFLEARRILDPITDEKKMSRLTGSYFCYLCLHTEWIPPPVLAVEFLSRNGMPPEEAERLVRSQVKNNGPEARQIEVIESA